MTELIACIEAAGGRAGKEAEEDSEEDSQEPAPTRSLLALEDAQEPAPEAAPLSISHYSPCSYYATVPHFQLSIRKIIRRLQDSNSRPFSLTPILSV